MIAPAELAQRKAVIAEARSWIGTAYHHRAAVKATWDADGNRLTQPQPTSEFLRRQQAIEEAEESQRV